MMHRATHRVARCTSFLTPLLLTLSLCFAAGIVFATAVGDQVELNATHPAWVPFHHEPRGTHDFQRLPDGTRARVIEIAKNGRWLKLSLPDGRTGWVTSRYVRSAGAGGPINGDLPYSPAAPAHRGRHRGARGRR